MNVFVTGVTGFLGSHFLHRRLDRPGLAAVLVRADTDEAARARLQRSLAVAAAAHPPSVAATRTRVAVERGDVSREDCGLEPRRIEALRQAGIDEFWHFAASLAFEAHRRDEIAAQNVGGARHALELAAKLGARRFVHVSTAYVAGRRTGLVPEALHPADGSFNNVYEETKCLAEHAIARAASTRGMDCRILRPSIVVGSSRTGRAGGSESGLYGFIRLLEELRRALPSGRPPIRLLGDPRTPLAFVAVDRVVDDMLALADRGFPAGPVHHLTPRRSIDAATALAIVCAEVGTPDVRIEPARRGERTPLEALIDQRMEFYGGYLRDPKFFERSPVADHEVGEDDLRRLTREYLRELATAPARRDPRCAAVSRTAVRSAEDRAAARL